MPTWSGIRKKLEEDYLCPALRGRIQYFATTYSRYPDHEGRAAIRLDGVEIVKSDYHKYIQVYFDQQRERRQELSGYTAEEKWEKEINMILEEGEFDQGFFYHAFQIFDNQSIEESLNSENALVRIFALLDRRVGKRRLLALAEKMEQEPDWVKQFYVLRMEAEGLLPNSKEEERT